MVTVIEDSVSFALAQACKAHRNLIAAELDAHGMHPGQELILMLLWEQEGLTPSELVKRCRVEAPTVSKTLHRMEALGLVTRRPDDQDARVSRVHLTEHGRQLRGPVEKAWNRVEEASLAGFTSDERLVLRGLLQTLRQNLA